MPRYDYQCTNCGHEFELVQSFREAGAGDCPECNGIGRRVYHAVPVIYKGSGFYTTDYGRPKTKVDNASKDGKDGKESATSAEKESSAAAEPKSEPASKTASEAKN